MISAHTPAKDVNTLEQLKVSIDVVKFTKSIYTQIKKCNDVDCCQVSSSDPPRFLPMPAADPNNKGHYMRFDAAFKDQITPTDKDIPSLNDETRVISIEQQGCANSKLTKQNARDYIRCARCNKPRVIYCLKKLKDRDSRMLKRVKAQFGMEYECGCILVPEGYETLEGNVFTRLMMSCSTPVETPFYQSSMIKCPKDICRHCAAPNTVISPDLVGKFTTLIPSCDTCQAKGKGPLKAGKRSKV